MTPFRRWPVLLLTVLAAGAASVGVALPAARDGLLYNHTPSVPVGLYVRTNAPIVHGAFVTVRARDVAPAAAHAHAFEDPRDRFIKRVAALGGDHVCAHGNELQINFGARISRRTHDQAGLGLPLWAGCRVLLEDEVLLLGETELSFDGRYWGPLRRVQIEGVWRPFCCTPDERE